MPLLSQEGLKEPGDLLELELELQDVLERPERLDAEGELEPLLEPELVLPLDGSAVPKAFLWRNTPPFMQI